MEGSGWGVGASLAPMCTVMANPELVHGESIGSLLRGIVADLRLLFREEIALARVEILEQAGHARGAAISLGMAAAAPAWGAVFLLIALAMGIAALLGWPVWAGLLALALLLTLCGIVAMASGRRQLRRVHALPTETVSTLKENATWIAKRLSRSEMSQTRADLERKLSRLTARARDMTPRRYARRLMPQYLWERLIGSTLLVAGSMMAWRRYPRRTRA